MAVNSRVKAVTAARIDSAALTGGYDLLNPGGLTHPCFLIRIVNDADVDVEISYDAVRTHDYIRAGSDLIYNFQANSQQSGKMAFFEVGKRVYVLGAAGNGYIYLVGYYQE